MIESTHDLAENKLIVLYVFKKAESKLSDEQITKIILENNLLNYFLLKQYISEMIDSGFLEVNEDGNTVFYSISQKGNSILDFFISRIPTHISKAIDDYIYSNFKKMKNETEVICDYTPKSDNEFIVNCKIFENSSLTFEVNINVATKNQAKMLCSNWENFSQSIYSEMIISLTKDRSN